MSDYSPRRRSMAKTDPKCLRCGHRRSEHGYVNFHNGIQEGRGYELCPTATFQSAEEEPHE